MRTTLSALDRRSTVAVVARETHFRQGLFVSTVEQMHNHLLHMLERHTAAPKLGEFGAATVYASDDEAYADYVAQPQAEALYQLIQQHNPELVTDARIFHRASVARRHAQLP